MSNALSLLTGGKKPAPKDAERISLALEKIRTDGGTQPRAVVDPGASAAYAEDMKADLWDWDRHELPVVFFDGTDYWLASGFHRKEASQIAGLPTMPCEVRQGTRRDAVLFSVGTNLDHGLRRTNGDKRRAVVTLLQDTEWRHWADREIARRCAVDHTFVARIRKDLYPADTGPRNVTRGGTTYQQNQPSKSAEPDLAPVEIKIEESGQTSFAPAPEPPAPESEPEPQTSPQAGSAEGRLDPINPQDVYLVGETVIYLPGFMNQWKAGEWLNEHSDLNPQVVSGATIWAWEPGKIDAYHFRILHDAISGEPISPDSTGEPLRAQIDRSATYLIFDHDKIFLPGFAKAHEAYAYKEKHAEEKYDWIVGRDILQGWYREYRYYVAAELPADPTPADPEAAQSAEAPAEQPVASEPASEGFADADALDDLDLVRDDDIALAIDDLEIALAQLSIAAQQGVLGVYIKRQRESLNNSTVTTLALLFEEVDNALRV